MHALMKSIKSSVSLGSYCIRAMISDQPIPIFANVIIQTDVEKSERVNLVDKDDLHSSILDGNTCHAEVDLLPSSGHRISVDAEIMALCNENILHKTKTLAKNLLDYKCLIIASTTVASELMGTIYGLYYIKIFLTIYHLNNWWLNLGQILFAIWNAVNDPMFGCVQDVGFAWCPRWFMNRRKVILYLGPVYAMSFMIFWIPWTTTGQPPWLIGLHLLVSLFVYDSMVSFVLSAQCGLFTEYTTQHQGRVRVVVYLEIASLLAGFVILPVDAISKSASNFPAFQICTAVVAVLASGFFIITGIFGSDQVAQTNQNADDARQKPETAADSVKGGYKAARAIACNRDFWCVVLGNFFHIMRTTGDTNFLQILTEALLSPNGVLSAGTLRISLFYTGCTVFSKVFLVSCWPLLHRWGAFVCLMMTLVLSTVNCIITAIIGRTYYSWLALFFLFENILSRGLWPAVYNIFFPDIIDEDMIRNKRKSPLSTMIFTLNALVTKPAYSIAPIIIVTVLNNAGYEKYMQLHKSLSECNSTTLWNNATNCTNFNTSIGTFNYSIRIENSANPESMQEQFDGLFSTMFYIACLYPLACIILEALCFVPYRLKFRHRRDEENEALGKKEACYDTNMKEVTTHC